MPFAGAGRGDLVIPGTWISIITRVSRHAGQTWTSVHTVGQTVAITVLVGNPATTGPGLRLQGVLGALVVRIVHVSHGLTTGQAIQGRITGTVIVRVRIPDRGWYHGKGYLSGGWSAGSSTVHRVLIDPRRVGTRVEGAGVQVTVRVRPLTTSMGCSTQCKEDVHRTVGGTKLQQRITTSLRWGNDRHGGPSRDIAGALDHIPHGVGARLGSDQIDDAGRSVDHDPWGGGEVGRCSSRTEARWCDGAASLAEACRRIAQEGFHWWKHVDRERTGRGVSAIIGGGHRHRVHTGGERGPGCMGVGQARRATAIGGGGHEGEHGIALAGSHLHDHVTWTTDRGCSEVHDRYLIDVVGSVPVDVREGHRAGERAAHQCAWGWCLFHRIGGTVAVKDTVDEVGHHGIAAVGRWKQDRGRQRTDEPGGFLVEHGDAIPAGAAVSRRVGIGLRHLMRADRKVGVGRRGHIDGGRLEGGVHMQLEKCTDVVGRTVVPIGNDRKGEPGAAAVRQQAQRGVSWTDRFRWQRIQNMYHVTACAAVARGISEGACDLMVTRTKL